MNLLAHAQGIADALEREWEQPTGTASRAWHAIFSLAGQTCYASLSQTRGVPGFSVWCVRWRYVDTYSGHPTAIAAAIWLGLEQVNEPLDWRLEL